MNIEYIAHKLADYISKELELDDNRKQVIAYGIFSILQPLAGSLIIILIGTIFNLALEALIVSIAISILRKYSGGAHMGSPERCLAVGSIVCLIFAWIIKNYLIQLNKNIYFLICSIIIIWGYYIIKKLAPVASPNKPISEKSKIRLKKQSILLLYSYFIITLLGFLLTQNKWHIYIMCLSAGVLWQCFTMTKIGSKILYKVDCFFNNISKMKRGSN